MSDKNQQPKPHKPINYKMLALFVLLFMLVFTSLLYGLLIALLLSWHNTNDNKQLGQTIINSAQSLIKPLPEDAKTGIVYFSAARLTLPQPPYNVGPLSYIYMPQMSGIDEELRISSNSDIVMSASPITGNSNNVETMFKGVAKYQACVRGTSVTFQKQPSKYSDQAGLNKAGSKVLANGKTVYFYTEPLCTNDNVLSYVKQIQSY